MNNGYLFKEWLPIFLHQPTLSLWLKTFHTCYQNRFHPQLSLFSHHRGQLHFRGPLTHSAVVRELEGSSTCVSRHNQLPPRILAFALKKGKCGHWTVGKVGGLVLKRKSGACRKYHHAVLLWTVSRKCSLEQPFGCLINKVADHLCWICLWWVSGW